MGDKKVRPLTLEECIDKVDGINKTLKHHGMTWPEIEAFWKKCFDLADKMDNINNQKI